MRLSLLTIMLFLSFAGYSQSSNVATITKETFSGGDQFSFVSKREIDEFLSEKWEHRFMIVYDDLNSISIDPVDQLVTLLLKDDYNPATLESIVKKFSYLNYKIVE